MTVHPQYIVDANQQPTAVILSLEEWQSIVEALENLDEILAYDQAKAGPQDSIPFEQAMQEIAATEEK